MQPEIQKYIKRKLSGIVNCDVGLVGAIRRDVKAKFGLVCSEVFVGWSPEHTSDVICIKITINGCSYAAYKNLITGEMS